VRATEALLKPAADATGGALVWLADGNPEIRRVRPAPGRDMGGSIPGGRGWIGFRSNGLTTSCMAQLPGSQRDQSSLLSRLISMFRIWSFSV
jgi:hypothetical protein